MSQLEMNKLILFLDTYILLVLRKLSDEELKIL